MTHLRQRGVSYLVLLLTMALSGIVVAGTATVWSQAQRRERETQLLWAGGQIRQAISAYARLAGLSDPGASGDSNALGDNRYPARLEDLLLDGRSLAPRRFLRQIYPDPITRSSDWGLIRNEAGRIVGVYSLSEQAPIKTGNFASADAEFEGARRYADWRFSALATPGLRQLPPAARGGASAAEARDTEAGASDGRSSWRPRPLPLAPLPSTPGLLRPLPGTAPGGTAAAPSVPTPSPAGPAASTPDQPGAPPPTNDEPAPPEAEPDTEAAPVAPPDPPGDNND